MGLENRILLLHGLLPPLGQELGAEALGSEQQSEYSRASHGTQLPKSASLSVVKGLCSGHRHHAQWNHLDSDFGFKAWHRSRRDCMSKT